MAAKSLIYIKLVDSGDGRLLFHPLASKAAAISEHTTNKLKMLFQPNQRVQRVISKGESICPREPTPFTKPLARPACSGGTASSTAVAAISTSGPKIRTPMTEILMPTATDPPELMIG